MLTCPYFEIGKCRYPIPCRLEMALPNDKIFTIIKKAVMKSWDLCSYRMQDRISRVMEGAGRN